MLIIAGIRPVVNWKGMQQIIGGQGEQIGIDEIFQVMADFPPGR